jgi:predicted TIM-barrel fold metal-dependent hydrolase
MDAAGVDYMVVSLTSPGVQDTANQSLAESLATRANDEFARLIANNTARYGAFAAVSMHNATQAGEELRRAVTELGFLGTLVNDFQTAGLDNSALRASIFSTLASLTKLAIPRYALLLRQPCLRPILAGCSRPRRARLPAPALANGTHQQAHVRTQSVDQRRRAAVRVRALESCRWYHRQWRL